jgi:ABC-2 type transport system permease protein
VAGATAGAAVDGDAVTDARPHSGLAELRLWWEQEISRPSGGSVASRAARLQQRWGVLRMLVVRDLKRKYATSYLGYVWTVLDPALQVAVYWLVWGQVARIGVPNYVLFISVAMMPWQWFRSALSGSTDAITGNAKLVTTVNLPREIYPLSQVITRMIEFLATLPLVAVIGLIYGTLPDRFLIYLPAVVALQFVLLVGCSLLLSATATLFRDVDKALASFLRILMYLSPILYPTGRLGRQFQTLFALNPLVGIINLYRKMWFPQTPVTAGMLTTSIVGALFFFVVGCYAFARLEGRMLKEL